MNAEESVNDRAPAPHGKFGFRLIGAMKLASAVMLGAAGFGIFRMLNKDIGASLEHFVTRFHLDPENRLVHETVSRLAGIDRAHLKAIGAGTFFYAFLHLIEGTGLILLKRWAEYFTVFVTGSLLPLELYEVSQKVTWVRLVVLAVNVAVLVYIVVKLRQQRSSRAN